MKLNRFTLTSSTLAVLAVLFVAVILISNTLFRGARVDLTANNLYTLSSGTKKILSNIDEPIHLYMFFSDKGSQNIPQLRTYATRVREMLEEMAARAGGKIQLDVIDPVPFSEDEDRATELGLQSVPVGPAGETIFFGLAGTNSTNGKSVIPFLQPDKENFLEYDIAKLIQELSRSKKPAIGLISSLPMAASFDQQTRQMKEGWAIQQQLGQQFEVRQLNAASLTSIDKEIGVLVLVHPKQLNDEALYAIDQFVMRGGRLAVFVDPLAETDESGNDPNNPSAAMMADKSSNLEKLFKAWGVDYDPNKIVLDRSHALQISMGQGGQPTSHPAVLGFSKAKEDFNKDDVTIAQLDTLNISTAGHFQLAQDATAKMIPLVQSSKDSMSVGSERVKFAMDPRQLFQGYQPSNTNYVIAGRLEGKFKTAFPEKTGNEHLTESKDQGQIILVADTDMLTDRLWVNVVPFFGQKVMNAFANNGDFVVNTVDNLSGSNELISIRGRATSQRPFTTVEGLKRAAEQSFHTKEQELQQQLSETERKLSELQSGKSKDQALILSTEQKEELEKFRKAKLDTRKKLREVRRDLDADIESLGSTLKFINIGLMPLLVTLAALGFAWVRSRRRKTKPA